MKKTRKVKIIGSGGIGSYLIEPLARYLSYTGDNIELTVIDGDVYEEQNKERQQFSRFGNKAEVTISDIRSKFSRINFKAQPIYVNKSNVIGLIRENDEVFLCVDNHHTRNTVSKRCEELDNVLLISGGNDFTDGDVFIFSRKDGKDGKKYNKTMTELIPKIAKPEDINPSDLNDEDRQGCQREAVINPQLLFTNLSIASSMCNCYYAYTQGKLNCERVCIDIITQCSRPKPEQTF
jgi:molybdopterin/thiamine biosynthesis adenylyltransferase